MPAKKRASPVNFSARDLILSLINMKMDMDWILNGPNGYHNWAGNTNSKAYTRRWMIAPETLGE